MNLHRDEYDWTLPVDKWSEEQLNTLATNLINAHPDWHPRQIAIWMKNFFCSSPGTSNILKADNTGTKVESSSTVHSTYITKPVVDWTTEDVTDWAQKECKLDSEDQLVLKKAKVTGATLLVVPDVKRLEEFGLPAGSADVVWAAIKKLKEPDNTQALKEFISSVPQQLELAPVSDANSCLICKLPLEPSKKQPERIDTVQNTHWFCLPDESIFNREAAAEQLQAALENNAKTLNSVTKQEHIFCSAFGFVGIGKTTVGQRVARKLHLNSQPVKYVYIDFSLGDKIDPNEQDDGKAFTLQLALRIIARLFTNLPYEQALSHFHEKLDKLEDSLKHAMTLTDILQIWKGSSDNPAVVLHFDEVNYLTDHAREYLVAYIGSAMVPQSDQTSNFSPVVPILPLLTGTTQSTGATIKLSKFANTAVSLSALSDEAQYSLVLSSIANDWKGKLQEDLKFKMVIKSTLGVPRLVMQLRRAVIEVYRDPASSTSVWSEVLKAIAVKFLEFVGRTYGKSTWKTVFPSQTSLLRLLGVCLRGKLRSDIRENKDLKVPEAFSTISIPGFEEEMEYIPGMQISVQTLLDGGFIHTADTNDGSGQCDILMPYCLLSALISSVDAYLPIESSIIAPISTLMWQELEQLEPHFLQLFVRVFNEMRPNLSVKFKDIWRGAVAQVDILETKIKIPPNNSFCIGTENEQWVSKKHTIRKPLPFVHLDEKIINLNNNNGVFLACAGNPLFDVRSKFEIDTSIQQQENLPFEPEVKPGANPRLRTIGSGTEPNKAPNTAPKTKLLNLVQMKASADTKAKITASKIFEWYMKAQSCEFPADYKVVFTYFTNKNMEWDLDQQNVMDRGHAAGSLPKLGAHVSRCIGHLFVTNVCTIMPSKRLRCVVELVVV